MRHRLVIQNPTTVTDSIGATRPSYAEVATVWGSVEPLSGGETVEALAQKAEMSHRIRIHARGDVKPETRFIFTDTDGNARTFDAVAVSNTLELDRDLEVVAIERYKVEG